LNLSRDRCWQIQEHPARREESAVLICFIAASLESVPFSFDDFADARFYLEPAVMDG
jgi:hypothetical protein